MRERLLQRGWILAHGLVLLLCLNRDGEAADSLLPPMNGLAQDFAVRRAGADCNASIRIGVTRDGVHRLAFAALTNAGVSAGALVGDQMRLFCRTQEVAIAVSTNGPWSGGDSLLFWGRGFDGTHTETNVYWLGFGAGGQRMALQAAAEQGWPMVTTCVQRVAYRPKLRYRDTSWVSEDFDHWVADWLTNGAVAITLATPVPVTNGTATLDLLVYGYTSDLNKNPDHGTEIKVNGFVIGTNFYDGHMSTNLQDTFPAARLQGVNTFTLRQTQPSGVADDTAYVRELGVRYERRLAMDTNVLVFSATPGSNTFEVAGLPAGTNLWVWDLSDPVKPAMLTGYTVTNVSASNATIRFSGYHAATGTYAVGASAAVVDLPASRIARVAFRGLGDSTRQADYIAVCPAMLRSQVYRLLRHRYSRGQSIVVAPVDDVYNEFGYGVFDPAAIKQFLGYAFHHWARPAPTYVVLVGSGSYDPRNYLGLNPAAPELVPVHMGMTSYKWTALDGWYVAVNGTNDLLADMMLGRIPVESVSALKNVVDKDLAFEADSNAFERAFTLLAADNTDGVNDFRGVCENIRNNVFLPAGVVSNATAYLDHDSLSTARSIVKGELNNGVLVATYVGHGDTATWAAEGLLTTNDVTSLRNTYYPLVCMMTCENGSFQTPTALKSMAEVFLTGSNGASGCLAASAVTDLTNSSVMATGFLRGLAQDSRRTVGESVGAGHEKVALTFGGNATELMFLIYFGDPAMVVNP